MQFSVYPFVAHGSCVIHLVVCSKSDIVYHLTILQKRALIATSSIVGDYDNKTATKPTSTRQQQIASAPRVAKPKESQ